MLNDEKMPEQELLSLEDAAEFLCVSKSTIYRLLEQRKLAGMKAGKLWRFRKEDLLAYTQRGPEALALTKVPAHILDEELAFFAGELEQAGATVDDEHDTALPGEAGKLTRLVRRFARLLCVLRGSDLHLDPVWEPDGEYVLLKLRVDGKLREIRRLPFVLRDALVLEWKRLAGLSIEERRRPQEGSARFGFSMIFRVAIVPTIYGEKVSVRTIPTKIPTLEVLGIETTPLKEWCQRPRGLILINGPTGSGKTTTRTSCIQEIITTRACNIMTVEDPVEYVFPHGVTHLQIGHFSLADGMRALMRHDPDVIVVGELCRSLGVDDREMVQLAVEAAETGHLVFSCMHANDTLAPLSDFLEMGIKRSLLAKNLIGICQQVLAPKLCGACRTPVEPEPELHARIRQSAADGGYILPDDAFFYNPAGCPSCGGRLALHEFITFTPAVRSAFLRCATIEEFEHAVREQGQLSFFAAQTRVAVAGGISLDTLLRFLPY